MSFLNLFSDSRLHWKADPSCPIARTEGNGLQIDGIFYIMGGFQTIDQVSEQVHVLDVRQRIWVDQYPMAPGMAHTHLGMTSDGRRYIYCAAGQKGPQCSPAIADCFVLDTVTKRWEKLPSLPEARYAPIMQLWKGRLHVLGGSKPDRITPATDHWSLGVQDGKAVDTAWRTELPAPKGGPHGTSIVLRDELYLFGGEIGDVRPIPGDPQCRCDWKTPMEKVYGDCFKLTSLQGQWQRLADMPLPCTHMESAIFAVGDLVVMAGGNVGRDDLSDMIQVYDSQKNVWRDGGKLPFPMKTSATYYKGCMYLITGQRAKNQSNTEPDKVLSDVWRATFLR